MPQVARPASGDPAIAYPARATVPTAMSAASRRWIVRMANMFHTRAAAIGLNRSAERIIAAGIEAGPTQGAVANGVIVRTRNDDAVSTSAMLAWPAMISSRSDVS